MQKLSKILWIINLNQYIRLRNEVKPLNEMIMKKVFMTMAILAAMFAAASCSCCNNSKNAEKAATECCADCDKKDDCQKECCDSTKCAGCDKQDECCKQCDSTATDCCQK